MLLLSWDEESEMVTICHQLKLKSSDGKSC